MALNLIVNDAREELKPRITVFGVGGAGGNAVNNMIDQNLEGVEFVVANTDAQALQQSKATARIQMGVKVTEGLGAGARPTVGAAAAEETIEEIVDHLAGACDRCQCVRTYAACGVAHARRGACLGPRAGRTRRAVLFINGGDAR